MTAFHAFVTGLAGRYSDIKQEQRNLAGQEKLKQIDLEKSLISSTPSSTKKYGNLTFTPTTLPQGSSQDMVSNQYLSDYANMFDGGTQEDFDAMDDADKKALKTNVLGAWSTFSQLVSPGTGGSGDNLKEYYRMFPNMDAFSKMPELHEEMTNSDPTKSIMGDVIYDSEHEILGIGNAEQGTPAIFSPTEEAQITGENTNVPQSLLVTPKKFGGKYDFGGKEKEFYEDLDTILTSRQFGGMEKGQANTLLNNKNKPWAGLAIYAAYGYSTGQMDDKTFGKEMAELQAIHGIDDETLMMVASRGLMKYEITPNAANMTASIMRKNKDYTPSQQKAITNAAQQSRSITEDVTKLLNLYQSGTFKTGVLGPIERISRGLFTDDNSILKQLGFLEQDSQRWINFEGVDGSVKGQTMGSRTFTSNSKEKGSLAFHIAGIQESITKNSSKPNQYYDYEKKKWFRITKQGQAEGYIAKKVLEMSLAYRLTVLEQGSGGNTISDKDFAKSLERLKGNLTGSLEQVQDGLKQILETSSRGMIEANIMVNNPYSDKAGNDLRYLYGSFRVAKNDLWNEIDKKYKSFYNGGTDGEINTPNEVMANRVQYLKNNLNFKLGIIEKGKGLYEDLTEAEMAYALGDTAFFQNADIQGGSPSKNNITKNNVTNNDTIIKGAPSDDNSLDGMTSSSTESKTQLAQEGFINLPSNVDKRPDRVERYDAPFRSDEAMQEMLEKDQDEWDSRYGQWYTADGTLQDGVSEITFDDLNQLFKDKKSKIIKLLENRILPRPDDLPEQVVARPSSDKGYQEMDAGERRNLIQAQRNWDLKYKKYYKNTGELILHPSEANKSLTDKVKENL